MACHGPLEIGAFYIQPQQRLFLGFTYPVGVRMGKNSIDTSFYRNSLDEDILFDREDEEEEEEEKEYQEFRKFLDEIFGGYK